MPKDQDMTRVEALAHDALVHKGILPYTELIEAMVSFEAESRHESFMGLKASLDNRREDYEKKLAALSENHYFTLDEMHHILFCVSNVKDHATNLDLQNRVFELIKERAKNERR